MRIYVADDEVMVLKDEIDIIRSVCPNAEVTGFRDGAELLEAARAVPCDVAFLDIHMPNVNGIDLAGQLKSLIPKVNIIFCTAHDNYFKDAMGLRASGYLLKPIVPADVEREMQELRYASALEDLVSYKFKVYCFGNFDVRTMKGEPVHFERSRAKETFAYLVHQNGRPSTLREIGAVLFEDEPFSNKNQQYIQKILSSLMKTMRDYDADDVIEKNFNSIAVKTEFLDCDYYKWIEEDPNRKHLVPEDYMKQYPWAMYS